MVLSVVGPIIAQSQATRVRNAIGNRAKTPARQAWESDLHKELDDFLCTLKDALEDKLVRLREIFDALGTGVLSEYVRYRLRDDARYLREIQLRLHTLTHKQHGSAETRLFEVLRWTSVSTVHPVRFQLNLSRLHARLEEKPAPWTQIKSMRKSFGE